MELILFGAPGVGKGTQAKILAEKNNLFHISTGDILREAVKNGTELGKAAKSIMDKGELVPDEIMAGIVKEALTSKRAANGFILDGFPRTPEQARMLDDIFSELHFNNIKLILVDVEDHILIERISGRRVCTHCSYIVSKDSELQNDECPSCGAVKSFIKRKDDDEEVITRRLKIFHETTKPVLDYYADHMQIIHVDGTQPIEIVTQDIESKIA